MFNLGFWEMVVLAVIALLVVGPEKLPPLARNIGHFLNDLKRTVNTITTDINTTIDEDEFLKEPKKKPEHSFKSKAHEDLEVLSDNKKEDDPKSFKGG